MFEIPPDIEYLTVESAGGMGQKNGERYVEKAEEIANQLAYMANWARRLNE